MKKRGILLVLLTIAMLIFPSIASAAVPTVQSISEEKALQMASQTGWNTMYPEFNPDNSFKDVKYCVKSKGSDSGTKYRTAKYTFKVGAYGPGEFGTTTLRANKPADGEVMYDKVTMDRNFIIAIIGATGALPSDVGKDLDTESVLYVGAVIEIYDVATDEVLATYNTPEECQDAHDIIGFPQSDVDDMKSRWQEVKLRESLNPDFFSTPEGSNAWQESYEVCAKEYDAEPGTQVTIPITLHNGGAGIAATDFGATWFGKGSDPDIGWGMPGNPSPHIPAYFGKEIMLEPDESKEFTATVTVPPVGTENRLVFKCNINEQTPIAEDNQKNNITVIQVGKKVTCDLAIKFVPQYPEQYCAMAGNSQNPEEKIEVTRLDSGTTDVPATITWTLPGGSQSVNIIATPGYDQTFSQAVELREEGATTIKAEVWPTSAPDSDESNNQAWKTLNLKLYHDPTLGASDGGLDQSNIHGQ